FVISFRMVACDGGQTLRGTLFHTDGTDTEQRKRADYFNVKELPNPEWVWADCFHGKQFVTSFVCVTVTHGAPFYQWRDRSRAEEDNRTGRGHMGDSRSGANQAPQIAHVTFHSSRTFPDRRGRLTVPISTALEGQNFGEDDSG